MAIEGVRPRRGPLALDLGLTLIVSLVVSLAITKAEATDAVPFRNVALVAGIFCLGPFVPFVTGEGPRVVAHPDSIVGLAVLLVPVVGLLVGYKLLDRPLATGLLVLAGAYWVLAGWFIGLAVYKV
jgi:hypothetical protein